MGAKVQEAEIKLRDLLGLSENQRTGPPLWYRLALGVSSTD
jgi:hypothetical protein